MKGNGEDRGVTSEISEGTDSRISGKEAQAPNQQDITGIEARNNSSGLPPYLDSILIMHTHKNQYNYL